MHVGVVYLLTDMQLAARLVVSIHSLRKWYEGPITLFTTRPESHHIGRLIAEDARLGVETARLRERRGEGFNASYLTKIAAARASPYDATVFLDADTIIVGSLSELFTAAEEAPVTVTQFCNLTTTDTLIADRLRNWRGIRNGGAAKRFGVRATVDFLLSTPLPAINTGVFAVQRDAPILKEWDALARQGRKLPLPDELAVQLVLPRHLHRILGGHFNCHPCAVELRDVRVWHFVGASHLEHAATCDIWLPLYRACQELDLAGISSWSRVEPRPPTDAASPGETSEASSTTGSNGRPIKRRDDFPEFLNQVGLVGEAVEVGVGRGEFSRVFLDRWRGRQLHLIDPWRHLPDYVDIANVSDSQHEANLAHVKRSLARHDGRYRICRECSREAATRFDDNSLDFVYIDANHAFSAVSQDLRLWFPKIKAGGILAGHDFLDGSLPEGEFGVASAVRAFADANGFPVLTTDDPPWRSWYLVKR
jgi:hypothetical protein